MKYIVKEVSGIAPANAGQQRVSFTVQDYPHKLSGFFTNPPLPGAEIEGEIKTKAGLTKTGAQTTYHNFWPASGAPRPQAQPVGDLNRVEIKIDRMLDGLLKIHAQNENTATVLGDILSRLPKKEEEDPFADFGK